jgi:hypothetical protein
MDSLRDGFAAERGLSGDAFPFSPRVLQKTRANSGDTARG